MDITKLNINWGGAGFPQYEGFLRDAGGEGGGEGVEAPSGPLSYEDRTEAALKMFDSGGDDSEKTAGGEGEQQQTEGGEKTEGEELPIEGALTDEQRQADPQFQELTNYKTEVEGVLGEFSIPDLKEAKLQLADSQVLYGIMRGEATPSQLLDAMATNGAWNQQQKQVVASNLIEWLTKSGFLKDGAAAAGGDGKKPAAGEKFEDPVLKRLETLEQSREREKTEATQRQEQAHKEQVFGKFSTELSRIAEQKGVPKEDHPQYVDAVAKLINGNKAILERIEKGNFVDVQRLFAQVHNAEVARLERWTKQKTTAAENKGKNNPKLPSGGAPPVPAAGTKRDRPLTRDERIAKGMEAL